MSDLGPKESSSNEKLDEIENPKDEKSNEIENKEEERIEEKKEEEKEKEDKNDDDKSEEEKEKSETSKDSDNDSESKDSKDDKDKDEDEKEENEEDDSEDDLDVDDDDDDANSDFSSTDKQKDPQHGYLNSKTENKNFFNNVNKNDYVYGIKHNKFYKIVGSKNIANDKRAEIYKFELKEVKSIQKINIKLNKNIQYMASIYGKATVIEENKKKEEKDDKNNLEKKEEIKEIEENKEENKKEENKKEEIKDEIKEEKKEETKEEKKEEKEEEKKEDTKEEKKEEIENKENKENKDEQKETKEKTKDKKEKEKNKDKGKKKTKKKINLNLFAVIKDLTEYTFFQKIRVIYLNSLNNPIVYYLRININTTIKEIINQFSSLYKYKKDRYSDKLPLNIFINGKKHSISNRTSSKYFIPTKFDYKNDYVLILEKQIFKLKEVDLGSRSNYINFKGVDVPHLVYNSVFNFEIDCLSVSKGLNFLDCKIYELKKDINLRQYTDNEHTIKQKLKEFLSLNWKDKTNFVTSFKSVKAIKSKENSYSAVLYELNRKFILLQGKMYIFVIKSNNKKLDAFYGRHISKDGVFIVSKNDKSLLSGFRGKSISDFIAYS